MVDDMYVNNFKMTTGKKLSLFALQYKIYYKLFKHIKVKIEATNKKPKLTF